VGAAAGAPHHWRRRCYCCWRPAAAFAAASSRAPADHGPPLLAELLVGPSLAAAGRECKQARGIRVEPNAWQASKAGLTGRHSQQEDRRWDWHAAMHLALTGVVTPAGVRYAAAAAQPPATASQTTPTRRRWGSCPASPSCCCRGRSGGCGCCCWRPLAGSGV
jgi:hypothetical protein